MAARIRTADEEATRRPLGSSFTKLWSAAMISNLADGLGRTAVPLVATTLTRDPLVISVITALVFVPWLLFGLPAGIIVDRVDRRWALAIANLLRVGAGIVLALSISGGFVSVWLIYACVLMVGLGETVTDNATTAMVASSVTRHQLDRANGRIQLAQVTIDNFVGTPIAGILFGIAIALPIWSSALGYALSIALVLMLPAAVGRPLREQRLEDPPGSAAVSATATAPPREGFMVALRFLWQHRYLRAVTIVVSLVGGLLSFAQATMILFFLEVHAVPERYIGFVAAGVGIGALFASLVAPSLVARFGRGVVMFTGSLLGGLGLALTGLLPGRSLAVIAYALSAAGVAAWNVPWGALRQELVPQRMQGTVIGAMRTVTWGMFPIATVIGGLVARIDLALPFWIGGGAIMLITLVAAPLLLSATRVTREHRDGLVDSEDGAAEDGGTEDAAEAQ